MAKRTGFSNPAILLHFDFNPLVALVLLFSVKFYSGSETRAYRLKKVVERVLFLIVATI
jgi:hypothetical protein